MEGMSCLSSTYIFLFMSLVTEGTGMFFDCNVVLLKQIPDHVTYPPVNGYVIALRKTSSYETPYTKYYVRDPQKYSHVIHDIHEQYPYEVKMAAFNAFGEGKFTRTLVIGKSSCTNKRISVG